MKQLYILLTMILAMSIMVSAANMDLITANNQTLTNASFQVRITTDAPMTECVLLASSALTNTSGSTSHAGGIVGIDLGNQSNSSATTSTFNWTINTNMFEDSTDFNLTAYCQNATWNRNLTMTVGNTSISRSSIIVGNTNPTAATGMEIGTIKTKTFTIDTVAVSRNTVSCSMAFVGSAPVSAPSCALGVNATNCSCVMTNVPYYTYDYTITMSDGTDSTTTAVNRLIVKDKNEPQGSKVYQVSTPASTEPKAVDASQIASNAAGSIGSIITGILEGIKSVLSKILG